MSVYHDERGRRLWALRHGESRANRDGVVVSQPGPLAFTWARLTERGRMQATRSAQATLLASNTLLVTSDFARAHETAQIAANVWGTDTPRVDIRLRERDFGSLEGGPSDRYNEVWDADSSVQVVPEGVETAEQVARRTKELVTDLLALPGSQDIVLVAHGDVLQIIQAWMRGMSPSAHRALPHLHNAELRQLSGFGNVPGGAIVESHPSQVRR
ncbi:histidine phosphatase family protein [Brevibacterium sp. FME37]|uniref:histidine phosphatase family protein n=1 Tax=Brevibacterium sp. FME37 TaxID=2742607 RepID=UPI0018661F4F|nr:histidine phosphatase family protein [Brevibacterium sp. FME37]